MNKEFGIYIRSLMEAKGLKERPLAALMTKYGYKTTQGTINNIINCRTDDIKVGSLIGLSKVFNVPVVDLIALYSGETAAPPAKDRSQKQKDEAIKAFFTALPAEAFGELFTKQERDRIIKAFE